MEFYAVLFSNIVVIIISINMNYFVHASFIFWRLDVNLIKALKFEVDSLEYDSVKAYTTSFSSTRKASYLWRNLYFVNCIVAWYTITRRAVIETKMVVLPVIYLWFPVKLEKIQISGMLKVDQK